MSSNLANTATLTADAGFRARVLAAIVEHGVSALLDTSTDYLTHSANVGLARAILWDPSQYQNLFTALVADDDTISGNATPADVTDEAVRAVIANVWTNVGALVPGL